MKQIILFIFLISQISSAAIQALFHPHAPTLNVIAYVFKDAESSAQIVLYNVDVTNKSPLIQYLKSPHFQNKLERGFKAQIIFEGYGTQAENVAKMKALEDLGLDVRYLGIAQKVHHKFAIIDAGLKNERLITGSANWSLASMTNYDENIFFMQNESAITAQFSQEFELLWKSSHEYGQSRFPESESLPLLQQTSDLHAVFNSSNYSWEKKSIESLDDLNPHLTKTIVAAIQSAKSTIEIATTRIKLAPIHAALLEAAGRGVEIKIVVSQAEYVNKGRRANLKPKSCGNNLYAKSCSSGVNFSPLLDSSVTGFENMQVRLKFFNLNLAENILQQMHNKYMIVDGRWVLSGSFNWSNSSEWDHIENVVIVDGSKHIEVLRQFQENFHYLWNMNRDQSSTLLQPKKCNLEPTVLSFQEIDSLRREAFVQRICTRFD